ncbi:hypothetical protein [Erythrobacter sp. SG61-1L]|uniref:hypothetical protein n=1 Tax=Erythrobacter sp. SG61-1L TaxID=1603897 RepID=UPI000A527621|nr:hypothetical protein [Erythrobacter sp. SG61-1L]
MSAQAKHSMSGAFLALVFTIGTPAWPLLAAETNAGAVAASPPTIDSNGDGTADAWDLNGDGKPDAWDSDGNRLADTWDTDADGTPDAWDRDGDGAPEARASDGAADPPSD